MEDRMSSFAQANPESAARVGRAEGLHFHQRSPAFQIDPSQWPATTVGLFASGTLNCFGKR
jgi:hypothetical protein